MQRDPRAFLWDAREAALAIQSFTSGIDRAAYADSELVQAAVERKFTVWNISQNALPGLIEAVQGLLDESA